MYNGAAQVRSVSLYDRKSVPLQVTNRVAGLENPATTLYNCYKVNQLGCDIHRRKNSTFGETQN